MDKKDLVWAAREQARATAIGINLNRLPDQPAQGPENTLEWHLADYISELEKEIKDLNFEVGRQKAFKEAFEKKWLQLKEKVDKLENGI